MSIIAWDGKTLAADKRAVNNGMLFTVTKIRKIRGHLVGSSGDFSPIMAMFKWFEEGADLKNLPECQKDKERWVNLIVITPDNKILRYEQDGLPYEVEQEKYAVGSGRDFALGAMAMGADAVMAVKVASQFEVHCGNGVDILTNDKT